MSNTYSQIYLHYVFSPKYRRALIKPEFETELFKYISGVVQNINQQMIQINGMPDHCHLLVRLRPDMAPSKFIQIVKTNSSRWINEKQFLPQRFNWQKGGGVFSVSHRNVENLIRYIQNQKEHHRKKRFRCEYETLLINSGIEYSKEFLLEFF